MSLPNIKIITIDGGAASGKSSTAKMLSKRFEFLCVESGAHYRSLVSLFLKESINCSDVKGVEAFLEKILLDTVIEGNEALLSIDGQVIPHQELHRLAVNTHVASFASLPPVRQRLLHYQRQLPEVAHKNGFPGLVMEGRDIGSVIFPDTPYKFFLEADFQARIKRRVDEGLEDSVSTRDQLDRKRKIAPLVCPQGAIKIDNTHLDLNAVVDEMTCRIEKIKNPLNA